MSGNLFQHVSDAVPDTSRVAIETDAGAMTYEDVLFGSAQLANALLAAGVQPGDRVAVQVEKSARALLLYLACLRAGAVYLPLNTAYTLAELGYFIEDAEPSLIVCDPVVHDGLAPIAEAADATLLTLDRGGAGSLSELAAEESHAFPTETRSADDLAAILYTSGTTGRSKGAMLTHGNLVSNAMTLRDAWRMTSDDVLLHALPIYHTHGLFVASNVALLAGASMLFRPRFDPDDVLLLMPRATVFMGVPTFYTRLLQHPGLTSEATAGIRLFVSGSAPLLADTHRAWEERTGHVILERYGMTETGMNTSNPYERERVAGTVGFPLADVELRITDPETGVELAEGEVGAIEVRGPNVFSGYWRMPEKTQAEIRPDGFFITGDLGKIDERGYVHIVGRGKDLIITGGFNVYPKEVETEIDQIPGVVESAVIGISHPDFGEGVTAVVVRAQGADLDERRVIAALESRLAKFKLPKRVVFVDDLPRNTMGKVQKNVLRDQNAGLYAG
jgi:malonyl-CoA/methylmalonyl-CoA synthetase